MEAVEVSRPSYEVLALLWKLLAAGKELGAITPIPMLITPAFRPSGD